VPQALQKPRCAMLELLNTEGAPRVHRRSGALTKVNAMNGWPQAFWHIRQWQIDARSGDVAS
jgi:hypothetical protein